MRRHIAISEICDRLDLSYEGDDAVIEGLNLCNRASAYERILTYATDGRYVEAASANRAVACIALKEQDLDTYRQAGRGRGWAYIVCEDPEEVFYDIHAYLYEATDFYDKYDFPARIGVGCSIHPSAVIEDGVAIGDRVSVGANTVIRRGTVIREGCTVGCNTTIGSEGFQILRIKGRNRRIVHCGGVLVEEYVSIGDNTAVCNSLFEGAVRIGCNAMIDNLVHVGHNVQIGRNAVVTAGTILCGSCVVEDSAWIGVNSSVLNRVTVGSGAKVGIGSVVTRDVPEASLAYGVPARVRGQQEATR